MYVSRALRLATSRHLRAIGICAAIAVGASLGVLAPPAVAAPANDQFANRTDLGDALPIHETESNEGATREDGEPKLGLLGNAGHSLWWSWQAPATGWVTVSTCQTAFPTYVGVFEGTELGALTKVAEGNKDEGPGCWSQGRAYTFRAQAGHRYAIGADGNSFAPPTAPGEAPAPPPSEGEIVLTIEARPPPPDDDFEDATPVENAIPEEPSGARRFRADVEGWNWGATKQPGEPDHAGDPGGASVWFAWTAPESGEVAIGPGFDSPGLLAVYTGAAVDELTPVASSSEPLAAVHFQAVGATRYMIAIDGKRDESTAEPAFGSFLLTVAEALKPGPGYPLPVPQGSAPPGPSQPQTSLHGRPVRRVPAVKLYGRRVDAADGSATFRFRSPTKGAKFRCAVDGRGYKACSSPFTVRGLKPGKHAFRVLARAAGVAGARPAVVHFNVATPRRRQHAAG
jgi:hypothetical protein